MAVLEFEYINASVGIDGVRKLNVLVCRVDGSGDRGMDRVFVVCMVRGE